jgi:crossover junction endodeoxyribonuclease RuvC
VVDSDGSRSRHVASGCIRTEQSDFTQRLGEIFEGVRAVIAEHTPQQVAVEQVFVAKNPSSALKLGQARGAAIAAAVTLQLPVFEYTPRAVKLALVGNGGADKTQVQHMVRVLLTLQGHMGLDESDALAIALCHAHSHATLDRLGALR